MSRTILIVEDDPDLQPLLEFTFETEGCEVLTFDEGGTAWEYLESEALPDCIVLDLLMPGVDGMEFLARRENSDRVRDVPVVVLTAWESEEVVTKVFDLDADDYITKPFSPTELLARVNRILKRHAVADQV